MEALNERKASIRRAINSEIDAFNGLLTGRIEELEEKLTERGSAFTVAQVIQYAS
jgi:hypothetical protein